VRLIVIAPYRARDVAYEVGQVLELEPGQAQALLADSPGSFQVQEDLPIGLGLRPIPIEPPVTGQVTGAAVAAAGSPAAGSPAARRRK
jgi:hypothetical protein